MPEINGVNFYLYLVEHHPGMEKRVIFMTGGPLSTYLDDFFSKNKTKCLNKPFEYEQLNQTIQDCLAPSSP